MLRRSTKISRSRKTPVITGERKWFCGLCSAGSVTKNPSNRRATVCVEWFGAFHGAKRPEKVLVVRGCEVGLTGTSATATPSGAQVR